MDSAFATVADKIKQNATSDGQRRICAERMPTVFIPNAPVSSTRKIRPRVWRLHGDMISGLLLID
jgi:hypothetical protein